MATVRMGFNISTDVSTYTKENICMLSSQIETGGRSSTVNDIIKEKRNSKVENICTFYTCFKGRRNR